MSERKTKCEKFGKGFDAADFECDQCDDKDLCKDAMPGEKKAESKAAEAIKSVKEKAKAKIEIKAEKKVEKKAKAEPEAKEEKKVKAEKKAEPKTESKDVEVVDEEVKVMTKEVLKKADEIAEKINAIKAKMAKSFTEMIMKGGSLMKQAMDLLSVEAFKEWCQDKIGYERTVVIRMIQAYTQFNDKPELIERLGQYKLFAVLAHPEPMKFLTEHKKEIDDTTSREFRDMVMEDKAKLAGDDEPKKDPMKVFFKALKSITSAVSKNMTTITKMVKRAENGKLKLDAPTAEALKLHSEELEALSEAIAQIREHAE
jgi:hypothetical protein